MLPQTGTFGGELSIRSKNVVVLIIIIVIVIIIVSIIAIVIIIASIKSVDHDTIERSGS